MKHMSTITMRSLIGSVDSHTLDVQCLVDDNHWLSGLYIGRERGSEKFVAFIVVVYWYKY